MSAAESDSLVPRIGRAIRERRKAAGLTLTQVAQRAGISVSHLSNIENGLSIASLPLLAKVASAVGISMADLTRDENRLVAQPGRLPDDGWRVLSHPDLETRIVAGSFEGDAELEFPLPLAGRDCFLTVLSGGVTVTVDGKEHTLERGDAIDARSAAAVSMRITDGARLVCSTSPASRGSDIRSAR